jgi:hypothetical protein
MLPVIEQHKSPHFPKAAQKYWKIFLIGLSKRRAQGGRNPLTDQAFASSRLACIRFDTDALLKPPTRMQTRV